MNVREVCYYVEAYFAESDGGGFRISQVHNN